MNRIYFYFKTMHSCFFPLRRVPLFSSFRNDVIIKIYVITLLYYLFIYLFTSYAAILIIYLSRKDALFFVILIILIPIFWHLREATLRFLFVFLFFFAIAIITPLGKEIAKVVFYYLLLHIITIALK